MLHSSLGNGLNHNNSNSSKGMATIYINNVRILTIAIGFMTFVIAFMIIMLTTSLNHDINEIVSMHENYINMIEKAETNHNYLRQGEVTGKYYDTELEKWYITYNLGTFAGVDVKYKTEAVYTLSEVSKYRVGDEITCAVNDTMVTPLTKAVEIDYKFKTVDDHGEYQKLIKNKNGSIIAICIMISIDFLLIILAIIRAKYNAKKSKQKQPTLQTLFATTHKSCPYCGSRCDANDKKCSNCGAVLK